VGKFSDLKEFVSNKFHKDKDYIPESKNSNASMAEGVNDAVYGINRKVVYAVVGTIVVAFISFSYFTSSDNSEKKNQQKQQQKQEEADKNHIPNKSGMPNDYEQMRQMNDRKAGDTSHNQPNGAATNTAKNNAMANNANTAANNGNSGAASSGSLPPIPQRSYNSAYQPTYSAPPAMPPQYAGGTQAPAASPQDEKDKYSAAISFGLDKKLTAAQDTNGAVATATPAGTAGYTPAMNNLVATNGNGMGGNGLMNTSAVPATSLISGGAMYMSAVPNALQAGTIIPAVLLNGINTDVGGQILAQVESDVYDSLTGSMLLIPAGSRLVGSYGGGAKDGQNRVNITWNYLMLPNGGSYSLGGSMIAADYAGYAGLSGQVNRHMGRTMQAGFWSSALAALGSVASGSGTNTTSGTYTSGQLASQGAMSNMMNVASSLFKKGMDSSAPTITISPGSEFNVFVTQTIQFNPY
jgi:type IV secretion system protein TrbI